MYSIKAAFKDAIDRIEWGLSHKGSITKVVSYDLDEMTKEEIILALQNCIEFVFVDSDCLECVIAKNKSDLDRDLKERNNYIKSNVNQLKRWIALNDENEAQIMGYIERHELNHIKELLED